MLNWLLGLGFLLSVACVLQPAQKTSLVNLYIATEGPTAWFMRNNWNNNGDPCAPKWFGVVCDGSGTNVVSLVLDQNDLAGTLPDLFLPELVTL